MANTTPNFSHQVVKTTCNFDQIKGKINAKVANGAKDAIKGSYIICNKYIVYNCALCASCVFSVKKTVAPDTPDS
jgi:hypothetical protein